MVNKEAVIAHVEGAREALESARHCLDGGFLGAAVNRAYYAFFYAATALLLTRDIIRRKHAGVLATFREQFIKTGTFSVDDSRAYGEAFELRNVVDYETLGRIEIEQAGDAVRSATDFVTKCEAYLTDQCHL